MGAGYGLLGPTPYQPKPSIVDRVAARLFPTGAYQGILDPSQTQQLGRQGLFNVGLNLLQAGGRQPMQHGTLANIGAAIQGTNFPEMAAQAIAAQNYRAKQQQTAAIRQTVTANAPQAGDAPDAIYQKLATMIGQLAGLPGAEDLIGKLAPALKDLKPTAPDRARWTFQTVVENGQPVLYRINEDTGVKYRIGLSPQGTKEPTPQERVASSQYASAAESIQALRDIAARNPQAAQQAVAAIRASRYGKLGTLYSELRGQLTDQDAQDFYTNYNNAILAVTPTYGGARPTQQLLDLEKAATLPAIGAGDFETAFRHLDSRLNDLQAKAGRAFQAPKPPPSPVTPKAGANPFAAGGAYYVP